MKGVFMAGDVYDTMRPASPATTQPPVTVNPEINSCEPEADPMPSPSPARSSMNDTFSHPDTPVLTQCTPGLSARRFGPLVKGIEVIHFNDLHGAILGDETGGGVARITTAIRAVAEKNYARGYGTVVLFAGDLFTGGEDISDGTPIIKAVAAMQRVLKKLQVQFVATLGNHEFDHKTEPALKLIKESGIPYVCANIGLQDSSTQTSRPIAPSMTTINIFGLRVAIMGLTTDESIKSSELKPPKDDPKVIPPVKVGNPLTIAEQRIDELKRSRAQIKILLTHIGDTQNEELAKRIEGSGVTVVIGGHSHDPIDEIPADAASCRPVGKIKNYCRAPADPGGGRVLGLASIDTRGRVTDSGFLTVGPEIEPDRSAQRTIAQAINEDETAHPDLYKIIGHSSESLDFTRTRQCGMGKALATAMLAQARSLGIAANFAFLNTGAARGPIREGDVSTGLLRARIPYDNTLVTMELTGEQLLEIMDHSEGRGKYTAEREKIRESGMLLQWAGERGSIDPKKTYRVITINYLVDPNPKTGNSMYFPNGIPTHTPLKGKDGGKPATLVGAFTAALQPRPAEKEVAVAAMGR